MRAGGAGSRVQGAEPGGRIPTIFEIADSNADHCGSQKTAGAKGQRKKVEGCANLRFPGKSRMEMHATTKDNGVR